MKRRPLLIALVVLDAGGAIPFGIDDTAAPTHDVWTIVGSALLLAGTVALAVDLVRPWNRTDVVLRLIGYVWACLGLGLALDSTPTVPARVGLAVMLVGLAGVHIATAALIDDTYGAYAPPRPRGAP